MVTEADVEFLWGGWGLQSHFHVQPNYSVEVVLCCVVVGVVTIFRKYIFYFSTCNCNCDLYNTFVTTLVQAIIKSVIALISQKIIVIEFRASFFGSFL